MKIRNGFVSNSSSSSFILLLPRRPKSIEDTLRLVYPMSFEAALQYHIHNDYNDEVLHAADAAKLIFEQIERNEAEAGKTDPKYRYKNPTKVEQLAQLLSSSFYYPEYNRSTEFRGQLPADDEEALVDSAVKRKAAQDAYYARMHELDRQFEQTYKGPNCSQGDDKHKARMAYHEADKVYVDLQKQERALDAAYDKLCARLAKKLLAKWKKDGITPFIVSFGDEDGAVGSIMEHGNAFDKVQHIKVNQH